MAISSFCFYCPPNPAATTRETRLLPRCPMTVIPSRPSHCSLLSLSSLVSSSIWPSGDNLFLRSPCPSTSLPRCPGSTSLGAPGPRSETLLSFAIHALSLDHPARGRGFKQRPLLLLSTLYLQPRPSEPPRFTCLVSSHDTRPCGRLSHHGQNSSQCTPKRTSLPFWGPTPPLGPNT